MEAPEQDRTRASSATNPIKAQMNENEAKFIKARMLTYY